MKAGIFRLKLCGFNTRIDFFFKFQILISIFKVYPYNYMYIFFSNKSSFINYLVPSLKCIIYLVSAVSNLSVSRRLMHKIN